MSQIAKAKTARLSESIPLESGDVKDLISVRTLIDFFPPSARELQMKVTNENIEWARSEKRVFLRQSLEIKLIGQ